jgi:hypothetical protein
MATLKNTEKIKTHILDPINGYFIAEWKINEDISQKDIEEYATPNGELFVCIAYKKGKPITLLTKKEIWDRQRKVFETIDQEVDDHLIGLKKGMNNGELRLKDKVIIVLRWVSFFPSALLSAWLAWILLNIIGKLSLTFVGFNSESFIAELYYNTAGHSAMGLAFIYVGAKIAPAYKKIVTYVLAGLGILISGFLLFPAIIMGSGWAIWGSFFTLLGIAVMTYLIYKGDVIVE